MSKWVDLGLKLIEQVRAAARERDPVAGSTTSRTDPPTHAVEQGVTVEYTPAMDGDADPGEVVWAWVPFEEDETKGKDRPVVIIGRSSGRLAGVPLTSKNNGRNDHVPVGTGSWDPRGRDSWAKADRLLLLDDDDVRREGAVLTRSRFDAVIETVGRHHDLVRQ